MLYLSILIIGLLTGTFCRKISLFKKLDTSISATIWTMLFVFSVSIGSNKELVSNVGNIGLQAFILAFCGVAGSVLAASMAFSLFFKKKGGRHEK